MKSINDFRFGHTVDKNATYSDATKQKILNAYYEFMSNDILFNDAPEDLFFIDTRSGCYMTNISKEQK